MKERTSVDRLESEAMRLSIAERAELARRLFASLEGDTADSDDEVERAWIEEAESRYQRYLSGATQSVPGAQALGRVREALREE